MSPPRSDPANTSFFFSLFCFAEIQLLDPKWSGDPKFKKRCPELGFNYCKNHESVRHLRRNNNSLILQEEEAAMSLGGRV